MPQPASLDGLGLPEDHVLRALLRACAGAQALRFADGEYIVDAGAASDDLYLLVRGSALVLAPGAAGHAHGHELAILEATPDAPAFAGEMATLDRAGRSASVRSAMACWAIRLAPAHLDAIIDGFPGLTRLLCRTLAARLRAADDQLRLLRAAHAMHTTPRFLAPGERLFAAGEPAAQLWQVADGCIAGGAPGGGVCEFRPGPAAFLDAGAYLRGGAHTFTAAAAGSAAVIGIDAASRAAVLRNYPEIALDLLRTPSPES